MDQDRGSLTNGCLQSSLRRPRPSLPTPVEEVFGQYGYASKLGDSQKSDVPVLSPRHPTPTQKAQRLLSKKTQSHILLVLSRESTRVLGMNLGISFKPQRMVGRGSFPHALPINPARYAPRTLSTIDSTGREHGTPSHPREMKNRAAILFVAWRQPPTSGSL